MANIANLLTEHMAIWTAADTEKKSGRGRASGNAGSVYGVKKLRELILELAVRGKLVPQDPNDEPASELLKRIQAEKAKLIEEGKLKKEKPLALIGEVEKPFELPKGWEWVRNCELFQLRKGRIPKSLNEDGLGLPYLDIDALDRNIVRRYSEELTCPQSTDKDILVVCDGSRSGLILDGKNGIIGSTLSIVDTPIFIQNYIKLIFKQGFEIFNTSMKGAAIPHLDTQKLLQNPTALPPLAEQHRIVAKVDELMALCDHLEQQQSNAQEAHETLVRQLLATLTQSQNAIEFNANWQRITAHFDVLFTTEASIEALKQTLLKLAVMGKLVPQDPNDEPASELLKHILKEKAQLIEAGVLNKQRPLIKIGGEALYQLPASWAWCRLGNILEIISDYHANGSYEILKKNVELLDSKDYAIMLRTTNFSEKNYESYKYITEKAYNFLTKSKLYPGDIIINKIGDPGAAYYVDDRGQPMSLAMNLFLLRGLRVNSKFLYLYLKSQYEYIKTFAGGTSTQTITKDAIENLLFPLCSISEQNRIITKVDALMALCDQLITRIQQANQQQQAIADALVAQAVA